MCDPIRTYIEKHYMDESQSRPRVSDVINKFGGGSDARHASKKVDTSAGSTPREKKPDMIDTQRTAYVTEMRPTRTQQPPPPVKPQSHRPPPPPVKPRIKPRPAPHPTSQLQRREFTNQLPTQMLKTGISASFTLPSARPRHSVTASNARSAASETPVTRETFPPPTSKFHKPESLPEAPPNATNKLQIQTGNVIQCDYCRFINNVDIQQCTQCGNPRTARWSKSPQQYDRDKVCLNDDLQGNRL